MSLALNNWAQIFVSVRGWIYSLFPFLLLVKCINCTFDVWEMIIVFFFFYFKTLEPLFKMVHYEVILVIRQFKGGPKHILSKQKCIDYIEK